VRPDSSGRAAEELRAIALAGLPEMFDSDAGLFSFRVRPDGRGLVREGLSRRYTAITLLGLAGESPEAARAILAGRTPRGVADALVRDAGVRDSIGDLALIGWAAQLAGSGADAIWKEIAARRPTELTYPIVEAAWALSALAADGSAATAFLRDALAARLRDAISPDGLFPHYLPVRVKLDTPYDRGTAKSRSHVSCFADLVYPVLALAHHGQATGNQASIACAVTGANAMCRLQGDAGQWWWHYDYRTGQVLERYPVYAVHQDAMAPMALFAAARAAGLNFDAAIAKGLRWLWNAPELDGGSLIDRSAGVIWRKVARREPRKLSRYIQAGASRLLPGLRAPGLDILFPPRAIDYEDRPYHLGWVLYAWPAGRRTPNEERRTKNEERRTKNAEPRTKNAEPRTKNLDRRTWNR
jgi:hypothetical protein